MNDKTEAGVPPKIAKKAGKAVASVACDAMTPPAVIAAATVEATELVTIELAPAAAPVAPIKEGPTMTDTINTTTEQTRAFAQDAQNKATALFSDLNSRTKSAMERSSKLFEDMNEFNKGNIEAMVESTRVAAKAAETLGQQAAETARKNFEQATAAMKSIASVKTPTELFQLQSDMARTAFDQAIADASKNSEMMLKLVGEVFQPISNRFAVTAEKIKLAA